MLNFDPQPPEDFHPPDGDIWVYGYGSLMWRPDFPHLERRTARLHGYHRALCVWSWYHRGSEDDPGLVFGLDLGGSCLGAAYRVAEADKAAVLQTLYRREMVTPVYVPTVRPIHIDGDSVPAVLFLLDRAHPQYAGRLPTETAARVVAGARGASGANPDYVASAVSHFAELGIHDKRIDAIHRQVAVHQSR